MVICIKHEGVDYELDEVDVQWTLEEMRDALANMSGSFKIFDAGEWKVMLNGKAIEGERTSLLSLDVRHDSKLEMVRVSGSNRPGKTESARPKPPKTDLKSLTCRFDAIIDIDDNLHTLKYAGMRSRLRDDAALRETTTVAPEARDDALRAIYAATDEMLRLDKTETTANVRGYEIRVLITDD